MSRQRRGARLLATDRILEGVSAVEICDLKSLARRKAGRYPVYEPSELDRWAEARIGPPQRSTSEVDPA
jgi:hypothetical protein